MNALLAGHFRPYDYGALKNLVVYGKFVPPEYPLEKIRAPVILYNGLNDFLAHPEVIKRAFNSLLQCWVRYLNYFMLLGCWYFEQKIAEYVGEVHGDINRNESLRFHVCCRYTKICLRSSDRKNEFYSIKVKCKRTLDYKLFVCMFCT